ncbi:MAG: hypothetical protein HYV03_08345 [Deltaproteobacteria bacterium]|nr:hypothetical protein [Deltaproteobacteria bacterium]
MGAKLATTASTPLTLIAHRGASAEFPENTLRSYEGAMRAGAGLVECDIHLSADGEMVVIHDATLDLTTDRKGPIAKLSLKEIQQINAGYPEKFGNTFPECRIPTLDEVVECIRGKANLIVEIKKEAMDVGKPARIVRQLIEKLQSHRMIGHVAIVSFVWEALAQCHALCPEIPLGALFYAWPKEGLVGMVKQAKASFCVGNKKLFTEERVPEITGAPCPVGAYTVNEPAEAITLHERGIRLIATDRIRQLPRELKAAGLRAQVDLTGEAVMNLHIQRVPR